MSIYLIQSEADFLFEMEKIPESNEIYGFPISGNKLIIPLTSLDKREQFIFDVNRASIKLEKITYQNRARKSIVLRRLDIEGAPHKNPDVTTVPSQISPSYNGLEIPCPHLHIYIEGFHHKWAIPATDLLDISGKENFDILFEFFKYCNVINNPVILNNLGI